MKPADEPQMRPGDRHGDPAGWTFRGADRAAVFPAHSRPSLAAAIAAAAGLAVVPASSRVVMTAGMPGSCDVLCEMHLVLLVSRRNMAHLLQRIA
jgi:hypothetical protein